MCSVPDYVSSAGDDVIELAAMAGLDLDVAQKRVLRDGLGERADGSWAAREIAVCEPRQNGKGAIIEAIELGGLFVFKEDLIIHSAHLFDTSKEAMRRLLDRIDAVDDLRRRVKRVVRSHGEEGIELLTGQRVRFRTRTKGGGRGLTGDRVIMDEAMILPEETIGALMPTMSAKPNAQACFFGSAVDQMVHEHGVVFARLRERGLRGDPRLAYFEWGLPFDRPDDVPSEVLSDPAAWASANPALGTRITVEAVESELRTLDPRTFAVERLGVGDWPATDGSMQSVIDVTTWDGLEDESSVIVADMRLAFDVSPDRARGAVGVAGLRADGKRHVEVIDVRGGSGWIPDRVKQLVDRHDPVSVVCDGVGPAASIAGDLEALGVTVDRLSTQEHAQACGMLVDAVREQDVRHLGQTVLRAAIKGAAKRPLGDAFAWSRKGSSIDISPLCCITFANFAVGRPADKRPRPFALTY